MADEGTIVTGTSGPLTIVKNKDNAITDIEAAETNMAMVKLEDGDSDSEFSSIASSENLIPVTRYRLRRMLACNAMPSESDDQTGYPFCQINGNGDGNILNTLHTTTATTTATTAGFITPLALTAAQERPSTSSLSLATPAMLDALRSKYRRDTWFLITADTEPIFASAWEKYQHFTSVSSFLLEMGRARDLEEEWLNPATQNQPEVEEAGENQFCTTTAAQHVIEMASVRFDWCDEDVLVRWGNDNDWGVVMQVLQKAWMRREFGAEFIDVFKIRVVLHLVY
ncbi:hypothetical protein BJX99DRAFT_180418 [Aspergillus californicus]